jgi:peptidyl-prolyl cis-trans isomerase C
LSRNGVIKSDEMKHAAVLFFMTAVFALAQAPPVTPAPAQGPSLTTLPPDTVVATVDGQNILAGDLQLAVRLNPAASQQIMQNPQYLLTQYALMRKLSALAEKAGLDKKSPYKESLDQLAAQVAYHRMTTMATAQLQEQNNQITIPPEDMQKYYDANKSSFAQARLKAIYIPFSANPSASGTKSLTEAEAKAKAEKLYAQLQAGADFVKLVKENSEDSVSAAKDGDFGTFSRSDQQFQPEVKAAVFALKQGEISKPVRQPQGYYIFRVEEISTEPFDKVQKQISSSLTSARFSEWVMSTQKSLDIKIVNEAAFKPAPAPAK